MKTIVFAVSLCAAMCAQSAPIALTGKIVDIKGNPVFDADVKLAIAGQMSTTGATGTYSLIGNVAVKPLLKSTNVTNSRVIDRKVVFDIETNQSSVSYSLFTCNGAAVGGIHTIKLDKGTYVVDPFAQVCGQRSSQMYCFKLVRNGYSQVFRIFNSTPMASVAVKRFCEPQTQGSLDKRMVIVDTIIISKPGFLNLALPVESYSGSRVADTLYQDTVEKTLFVNNDTTDNHVMFFSFDGNKQPSYFYRVQDENDSVSYYATFETSSGERVGVVYSKEFIPIQWVMPGYNITVYRIDRSVSFDPHAAFHAMGPDTTQNEDTVTLDIYPSNLAATISSFESAAGISLKSLSDFLSSHNVTTFDALEKLAQGNGSDKYLYANAAFALGTMKAALMLQGSAKLGKRAIIGDAAFKIVIKIGARAAADLARKALNKGLDPAPTGINILLCQGAAKYGVCHYRFFYCAPTPTGAVDPDAVDRCMSFCQTTMGCFTNICMPMDLSEATMGFGGFY